MIILSVIKSGFFRAIRAWRGILIFWLISLGMVSFLIIPLKASLKAVFGSSMIIEKLVNGINIDVLSDMGSSLHSIAAALFAGVLILGLATLIINAFITGGLFDSLRKDPEMPTSENFFRTSAKNFWPYIIISAILYLIIILLIVFIIVIPVSIAGNSVTAPEGIGIRVFTISCSIFIIPMTIILLVADYARAWQASRTTRESFKAIGFGFRQAFRTFFSSFTLMITMLLFQTLLGVVVVKMIEGFTPSTGGKVFLLFIISQLLFVVKIFLKSVRYGSVTSHMELNSMNISTVGEHTLQAGSEQRSSDIKTETDV